jgi:hypothetical protein
VPDPDSRAEKPFLIVSKVQPCAYPGAWPCIAGWNTRDVTRSLMRACELCGVEFEPRKPSQRFCTSYCRKRAHRQPDVALLPGSGSGGRAAAGVLVCVSREKFVPRECASPRR